MGMYTELNFSFTMRGDTPTAVIKMLVTLSEGTWEDAKKLVDEDAVFNHDLFKTERWTHLLQGASYYFSASEAESRVRYDEIGKDWRFTVRSNIKNYCGEIALFLSWVEPFLDMSPGDFLGYFQYENDEAPTLVFYKNAPDISNVALSVIG